MSKHIDLTGQRFGRLVVIKRVNKSKQGNYKWMCRCDCGKEIIVPSNNLKRGHTKSCGCLRKDTTGRQFTKHGYSKTPAYCSWYTMIQRCANPNHKSYHNYGGQGITVCKRWMKFKNFLEDMGERPKGRSIDRKNNDKGYYKKNCRWATRKQQQRNKQNNRYETYKEKTQLVVEWAEKYNIPYRVLWRRLYEYGWPIEKALTTPVKRYRRRKS